MSNNRSGAGGSGSRPNRRPPRRPGAPKSGFNPASRQRRPAGKSAFKVLDRGEHATVEERLPHETPAGDQPFRILIAVHRPRYRGRAERAAALVGWNVVTLLNKQDVVGQIARPPAPPDLVVLSGDFGRQRDYGIFRAIQAWRKQGMRIVGLVEDCQTAPEGYPDSVPERLCDVCLPPPYKTADLRALYVRLSEEMRGVPAPPPRSNAPLEVSGEVEES